MKKRLIDPQQEMKEYFERKFNRKLTDAEVLEISNSLYYLGKAIYEYKSQVSVSE